MKSRMGKLAILICIVLIFVGCMDSESKYLDKTQYKKDIAELESKIDELNYVIEDLKKELDNKTQNSIDIEIYEKETETKKETKTTLDEHDDIYRNEEFRAIVPHVPIVEGYMEFTAILHDVHGEMRSDYICKIYRGESRELMTEFISSHEVIFYEENGKMVAELLFKVKDKGEQYLRGEILEGPTGRIYVIDTVVNELGDV